MTKIWHPELSNIHESVKFGEDCIIHSHVWIGEGVVIGNRVKIQAFSFIPNGVIIKDDVFIGPRVTFTNDKHPPSGRANWQQTIIEDGVSIGASTTILPGITIGHHAKIGAGALVTKNISANAVAYGVPAKEML